MEIKSKPYQPVKMSDRHHRIMRLHLLGYSGREIAVMLGMSESRVSIVLNSNLGRCQAAIMRAEADTSAIETARRIREVAPKALQVIEDILADDSVPSSVRLRAAQDALDRAGHGAVKKLDVRSTSVSLSSDELEDIKSAALARAKANGLIVDMPENSTSCHSVGCQPGELQ